MGSRAMEVIESVSLLLIVTGVITSNLVTRLLYRYHSSILYIKRNILTYLSLLLVTSINLICNATNVSVLSRLIIGLQPPLVARLLNCFLSVCFYLFLATNVSITVFRIVLVTKVNNHFIKQN